MPTKTVTQVLAELHQLRKELPWSLPTFQEHTGVTHGLFPDNEADLPFLHHRPGKKKSKKRWTRQNSDDVQSFYQSFYAQPTEADATAFMKTTKHPGKLFLDKWVNDNYQSWGLHDIIMQTLKEAGVHPFQLLLAEQSVTPFPNSKDFIPLVREEVAMKIFGPEIFPPGSNLLPSSFRYVPAVFINRSWVRVRVKSKNDIKRLETLKEKAYEAFEHVQTLENPTKADVRKVIAAVADWKKLCDNYLVEENRQEMEKMMSSLHALLNEMGVSVPILGTSKAKGSSRKFTPLASEDDIAELSNLFDEYFNHAPSDEPPLQPRPDPELLAALREDGAIGMEVEATMSPEQLGRALGYRNGLPFQFNEQRHANGMTVWDHPEAFKSADISPLRLFWHQLAGLHSIIRNCTTPRDAKKPSTPGMLIADEVGLGKTALCLMVIAFVNQVLLLRKSKNNLPMPPILENRTDNFNPEHPHLIVVPGTLRDQWAHEVKTLFRPSGVDIFFYDGIRSDKQGFWDVDGPYHSSRHSAHNRIILTTQAAIRQDFQLVYGTGTFDKKNPWSVPKAMRGAAGTLYGQRYGVVIFDEAHEYRNDGVKHLSALQLASLADLSMVASGTPLHTSPKDIVALSRIVGAQKFFDPSMASIVKADQAELQKARREEDPDYLKALQIKTTRRYQGLLLPNMLRRTTKTLRWDGKPLLHLPPYKPITLYVELTEREYDIIDPLLEEAKENANTGNENGISATRFYHKYRMGVNYAKADPTAPNPTFESLEAWEAEKSTKMDTCAQIIYHYLSHDDIEDVTMKKGGIDFPPPPPVPKGSEPPQTRKIIVYAAFPSMSSIFRNVLELYGIECVYIDGTQTLEKRNEMINEFKRAGGPRVLIFSSVGSVGLNLSVADVVLFLDQPWSAQDEEQMRARAHRQPQTREVKVISVLALKTADTIINTMARQKKDMFEAFVNKDLAHELQKLLSGFTVYAKDPSLDDPSFIDDGDEEESDSPDGGNRSSRARPKVKASEAPKKKSKKVSVPSKPARTDVSTDGRDVAIEAKGLKKKSAKQIVASQPVSADVVMDRDESDRPIKSSKKNKGKDVQRSGEDPESLSRLMKKGGKTKSEVSQPQAKQLNTAPVEAIKPRKLSIAKKLKSKAVISDDESSIFNESTGASASAAEQQQKHRTGPSTSAGKQRAPSRQDSSSDAEMAEYRDPSDRDEEGLLSFWEGQDDHSSIDERDVPLPDTSDSDGMMLVSSEGEMDIDEPFHHAQPTIARERIPERRPNPRKSVVQAYETSTPSRSAASALSFTRSPHSPPTAPPPKRAKTELQTGGLARRLDFAGQVKARKKVPSSQDDEDDLFGPVPQDDDEDDDIFSAFPAPARSTVASTSSQRTAKKTVGSSATQRPIETVHPGSTSTKAHERLQARDSTEALDKHPRSGNFVAVGQFKDRRRERETASTTLELSSSRKKETTRVDDPQKRSVIIQDDRSRPVKSSGSAISSNPPAVKSGSLKEGKPNPFAKSKGPNPVLKVAQSAAAPPKPAVTKPSASSQRPLPERASSSKIPLRQAGPSHASAATQSSSHTRPAARPSHRQPKLLEGDSDEEDSDEEEEPPRPSIVLGRSALGQHRPRG
ncbi:hypothetical protein V5O48_006649 [Marasmius crinis-equi]|uniref:Helicase C-terminal domain-containing protein n=1 Tax=Marasmius crinis-equi TaxID=585013 RepID=A0ABR3FJ47_9AGAR